MRNARDRRVSDTNLLRVESGREVEGGCRGSRDREERKKNRVGEEQWRRKEED
jgi:hypothetical protein